MSIIGDVWIQSYSANSTMMNMFEHYEIYFDPQTWNFIPKWKYFNGWFKILSSVNTNEGLKILSELSWYLIMNTISLILFFGSSPFGKLEPVKRLHPFVSLIATVSRVLIPLFVFCFSILHFFSHIHCSDFQLVFWNKKTLPLNP